MNDLIDQYPDLQITNKVVLKIRAPTGRGKTKLAVKLIKDFLKDNPDGRVVWLTHRVILAMKAAEELATEGFAYYRTRGAYNCRKIVVSMESFHKWRCFGGTSPVVLVMDECSSLCGHLVSSTMVNSFVDFKAALLQLSSENSSVVAMDAYWTPAATTLLHGVFGNHALIQLGCAPLEDRPKTPVIVTTVIKNFTLAIINDINNPVVKGIFLWAGGRSWLNRFLEYLVRNTKLDMNNVMFVHADSLQSEKKKAGVDPDTHWTGKRIVACTPALTSGVSFTEPGWAVYVIGNPHIFSSAEILMQAAGRVRQPLSVMFTVLDWEKHTMHKLPETLDGIRRLVGNYKMAKFAHIRRFLGLSILESERDEAIVSQMFEGVFSQAILMHLLTIFKDYNDPFKYLEDKLDRNVFDVTFEEGEEEDLDIYLENTTTDIIKNPGFYQFRGLEVAELDSIDLTNSSDCLSASLDQCSNLDFFDDDVEPENFELDERAVAVRWPSTETHSKFRALEVRALKGFFKLFCTLGLFGNAFTNPYKDHDINSISYITQMGVDQMAYSEVYAHLIAKHIISEFEFSRLWEIYQYIWELKDYGSMIKNYQVERTAAIPAVNPSRTLEDIIIIEVLTAIKYEFVTLSCPSVVCTPELFASFKKIARLYSADLEPTKLPLIKHLVAIERLNELSPNYYEALKTIGKLIQACVTVLGIPSPLGDIHNLKRNPPYYAERGLTHGFRRAFIAYCLKRRHLFELGGLKRAPSTLIPTLYYRFWYDIPECATLGSEHNENINRFIAERPFREAEKTIDQFFEYDKNDPFRWIQSVEVYDGELNCRMTMVHSYAPRRYPTDPDPVLFTSGRVALRVSYDDQYDWVLITGDRVVEQEIGRLYRDRSLTLEYARLRYEKELYYMKKIVH